MSEIAMTITPVNVIAGTRILVRRKGETRVTEMAIAEWSPSGYARVVYRYGEGEWLTPEQLDEYVVVDILKG